MGSETISGRMAQWLVGVKFGDLPRRVVEEAKNQILSVIASVHAGHFSDVGRASSRTVKEWAGGKDSTLIPSGEKAPSRPGNIRTSSPVATSHSLTGPSFDEVATSSPSGE